ncbi:MAG: molybdate ABC transporter permease subunit [Acidobacteria bacterium]|nr:molybdate ABC transporter permease subunit [Acidobacteriota bacterium]MBV9478093.1 molybdate ABC transporter permease subunit [Acidobacteriota bacterium]
MHRRFLAFALLLLTFALHADEVRVFAAASLADAVEAIGAQYARAGGGRVLVHAAGSPTLARQIEEGAPADVFFSADNATMDRLVARGLVDVGTRVSVLSNALVVVVPRDAPAMTSPRELLRVRRLALAEPSTVPAGIYARTYLERKVLWTALAPHVIPTENVRGALRAVASGGADAAIVYRTDALTTNDVRVAYEVPRDDAPPIAYAFAVLTHAHDRAGAQRFLAYATHEGLPVFAREGFITNAAPAPASNVTKHDVLTPLWLTLRTASLSTFLILVPGLAVAWLLARFEWRGKSLVETLVALPLVMPPVATGLLLLEGLGRLRRSFGLELVFTWRAVVLAMMVMSFPLLVRAARVAFEEVNPRLEQIARTLGATNARVFATITLPLAARGIVGGLLLAFARAIGEFGATILVAGNIPGRTQTLSLAIYESVQLGRDADAFRLLFIAVLVAFVSVWIAETFLRRGRRAL